ncbi:lactococcin 972 family bacteriocin [Nocardia sp. CDC159]
MSSLGIQAAAWAESPAGSASPGPVVHRPGPGDGGVKGGSVLLPDPSGPNNLTPRGNPPHWEYPEGGIWDKGTDPVRGWSNYWHPRRNHGATTRSGSVQQRDDQGPEVWAYTSLFRTVIGGDGSMQAFWRINN